MSVYLAGPMAGLTIQQAGEWRKHATLRLSMFGIAALNPVGEKEARLVGSGVFKNSYHKDGLNNAEVFVRDTAMVRRADMMLVNLAGINKQSFGTPWEMGFAYALGKPIVVVGHEDIVCHPFIERSSVIFTGEDGLTNALSYVINTLSLS